MNLTTFRSIPEQTLLSVRDLNVSFRTPEGTVEVIRGVNLSVERGMTVALAGESGSGKSMTALAIMGLVPPPGYIAAGSIRFDGKNLISLPQSSLRALRGSRMSMIFQEPMTSLNPVLTIGDQLCEPMIAHEGISRGEAKIRAVELLKKVGIPAANSRMEQYSHQMSGGMRQRVMIAMALACSPDLLIADEPTTALDVTIQAQILELLDSLRADTSMATLLITHDLGIVAERADYTCVMYAGQIVEEGATPLVLGTPSHPYTRALIASLPQCAEPGKPIPTLDRQSRRTNGIVWSTGCPFQDRCPIAVARCATEAPPMTDRSPKHSCRCWL